MSKARKKHQSRKRALWHEAKREGLAAVRDRIGLTPDELIPDAVLLAEVDHYLPPHSPGGIPDHSTDRCRQWFGFRLIGMADTEAERVTLAERLQELLPGLIPWGQGSGGPSRRSATAARRRNRRRRGA